MYTQIKVLFLGTGQKLSRTSLPPSVIVAGCPIMMSYKLRTLGITSDAALTIKDYVKHAAKACNFHICDLHNICHSISCDIANTMVAYKVGTHLDYSNVLLHGATEISLNKLQRVQNKLAEVVCNIITRQQHTVDFLCILHWLPIRSLIMFKVTTVCYKEYRLKQPNCLHATFEPYVLCRGLRLPEMNLVTVTKVKYQNSDVVSHLRHQQLETDTFHKLSALLAASEHVEEAPPNASILS